LRVAVVPQPLDMLEEWCEMYQHLIRRHHLVGVKAFSQRAFAAQFRVPGLHALRADVDGIPVAAQLWYVHNRIAYSHLTAITGGGYGMRASYALYATALDYLATHADCADLGAGAGRADDGADGLFTFKRGWSTSSRIAYLCGRTLDHDRYGRLTTTRAGVDQGYYPAYRSGELA
jgi:hypothetical protein